MVTNLNVAQGIVSRIKGWPKPVKYIGGGVNGRVYETNNGRLVKFIYNFAPVEYQALRNLQGTHIVPRFENKGLVIKLNKASKIVGNVMFPGKKLSNHLTVFVMGKVGGNKGMTLSQYLKKYPNANKANIQRRVEYIVEQLHLKGWSHGNLHSGNIIVSVNSAGKITGMWAIDFGRAYKILRGKTERESLITMPVNGVFKTKTVFVNKSPKYVPLYGKLPMRANVHMMDVHYGKRIEPEQERKWRNTREFAVSEVEKLLKSPKRRTQRRPSAPAAFSPPRKRNNIPIPRAKKRHPSFVPRRKSV